MIKINYDSLGEIISIYINIDNKLFAPIPWNTTTKSIDWNQITYKPTLDSIQGAWNTWAEGKDLSIELRPRPDLATNTVNLNQPNWRSFNGSIMNDSGFKRVVAQCPVTPLISLLFSLVVAPTQNENIFFIQGTWNNIIDTLTIKPVSLEINSWNTLATNSTMQFNFDANGKMQLN